MHGSAIEVLAAVLIAFSVVKLVVVVVNFQAWMSFAKTIYSRPAVTAGVSYALAGLVLYLLVSSGLSIVQVLAVSLFVVLLLVPGIAPYAGVMLASFENKTLGEVMKLQWHYTAVWLTLLGWGLYELVVT